MSTSYCQKCLIEHRHLRGVFLCLDDVWQTIRQQNAYPNAVAQLLADTVLASGLLVSTLKIAGKLIIQCQNEGPIELLVTKATHDLNLQATAKWQHNIPAEAILPQLNHGKLVVSIMQDHTTDVHQSFIELNHPTVAEAFEAYFMQSEQLATRLWFSSNEKRAVGLLVQALPGISLEEQEQFFADAKKLPRHFLDSQLENAALDTGILPLFPNDDITIFDPQPVTSDCRCGGLPKFQQAVQTLGKDEAIAILEEKEFIEVQCDFCGQTFNFNRDDVEHLFARH